MRLPRSVTDPGRKLLRGIPVRIRSGPNRGRRWSLASSGRGYRSGTFESERLRTLCALVRPGDGVWDIGAHKGYVSLALARAVGDEGRVVAFEPSTTNLWFLRKHIAWNAVSNVRVLPLAVSDRDGEGAFGGPGSSITFALDQGSERVRVATLESLREEEELSRPNLIKIDVEGAEGAVLRGVGDLRSPDTLISLSVHHRPAYHECSQLLRDRGYSLYPSATMARRLESPSMPWGADHELLAAGEGCSLSEAEIQSLPLFGGGPGGDPA